MVKRIWKWLAHGERVERLPGRVRRLLMWRYGVDGDVAARLRWARRRGYFAGRPTSYVRIFDGSRIGGNGRDIDGYGALDTHMDVVLFEGRWHDGRLLVVKDRRQPKSHGPERREGSVGGAHGQGQAAA